MKITKQLLKEMIEEVIKEQTAVKVTREMVDDTDYAVYMLEDAEDGAYRSTYRPGLNWATDEEGDFALKVVDEAKTIAWCKERGPDRLRACIKYAKKGWIQGLDTTKLASKKGPSRRRGYRFCKGPVYKLGCMDKGGAKPISLLQSDLWDIAMPYLKAKGVKIPSKIAAMKKSDYVDGKYGPSTRVLVKLFQAAHNKFYKDKAANLARDGRVGPQTNAALQDIARELEDMAKEAAKKDAMASKKGPSKPEAPKADLAGIKAALKKGFDEEEAGLLNPANKATYATAAKLLDGMVQYFAKARVANPDNVRLVDNSLTQIASNMMRRRPDEEDVLGSAIKAMQKYLKANPFKL